MNKGTQIFLVEFTNISPPLNVWQNFDALRPNYESLSLKQNTDSTEQVQNIHFLELK